jgi:PTS system D-glucosamine-specific IIC component
MYIPGIVTCFLTGITEPIQFSFMFTCFPLYAMTAILSVLTIPYASLFSVKIGTGFACGLLDFIIYGILPGNDRTNWIMFIPTCILYSLPVFALTYFAIKKFDWKTPGREDETEEAMNPALQTVGALAEAVYKRLGGKENIVAVNACATRLRVTLKSAAGMKNDSFNSLGASGTVIMGNNLQIIFGGKAANLRDQIAAIMAGSSVLSQETISALETAATEIKDEEIAVPMSGEVIPLAQVQDTVFAEGMLGDGFAVVPKDGVVYAPVNGVITNVMLPSKHAVSIVSDGGKEIMIHMGIDTVKLAGKGFEVFVKEGDRVTIGQKIATMDLNIIKENGYSEVVPMVFMNIPNYKVELEVKGAVKAGTKNFLYFLEKEPV